MNLQSFLHRYFTAHQCEIAQQTSGSIVINLTEERDKTLMNRPFYWQYVKSTGATGQPLSLSLHTEQPIEELTGKEEFIHFGSPRLLQIFNDLRVNEKWTKQFQNVDSVSNTPLYPWLLVNLKLVYEGKYRREELFSIGLNLINGTMKNGMMELVKDIDFSLSIGDLCYTISPIIKPVSGFGRIEKLLQTYVDGQDHKWAEHSLKAMEDEIRLLRHFIDNKENGDIFTRELAAIQKRHEPEIRIEVINAGLLYLSQDALPI